MAANPANATIQAKLKDLPMEGAARGKGEHPVNQSDRQYPLQHINE